MSDLAVALKTLGCKVNRVEAEKVAARLLGAGVEVVDEADAAVIIVTTCTVTGEADRKARKAIRHALDLAQAPVVVVSGCLAAIDPEGLAALGDRVIVEAEKDRVAEKVASLLGTTLSGDVAPRVGDAFRTRAAVKIEDGCDAFCAYCIVPYARGVPRSAPLADIVAEVTTLAEAGVREVVLTGINIGRYRDGDTTLPDVIEAIAATGVPRIRISSIEPGDVDERFCRVVSAVPAFCAHLHIPLQSGCDRTLQAMGRTYDTATFTAVLERVREALPGVAITTDILTGFPGETDVDFEETLAFVERSGFARLHVFRYSPRAGTSAATMPQQVSPAEKDRRSALLRELDGRLRERFAEAHVGGIAEVLVEHVGDDGAARGTTREYLTVAFEDVRAAEGDLVRVRIEAPGRGVRA